MWLWTLIAAVVGGLALTLWGLWWLWHKVTAIGEGLEGLLGRLDEMAAILDGIDLEGLDPQTREASGKA